MSVKGFNFWYSRTLKSSLFVNKQERRSKLYFSGLKVIVIFIFWSPSLVVVCWSTKFLMKMDRPQCTYCGNDYTQKTCYSLHGFLEKLSHRLTAIGVHASAAFISQSCNNKNLWMIDSGAFDHIASNHSLFSSISSPKLPHFITLADGSNF